MADPLYELLLPHFDTPSLSSRSPSTTTATATTTDPTTAAYLKRLTTLPLTSLSLSSSDGEGRALSHSTQSLHRALQALSKRSHRSIIDSAAHLSTLTTTLPSLAVSTASLRDALPKLDDAAIHFSENYNSRVHNDVLDRRRKALLLSRNVDRLSDILDLPTLLSSAISSSNTASTPATSSTSNVTLNYASAIDLNAHIRRLHTLYPESPLVSLVEKQADTAMREMATNLIAVLRTNSLKLASAMRTISWLRRVAPELDPPPSSASAQSITSPSGLASREGSLGSLFLVCRLANLHQTLGALEPLRELADQETSRLASGKIEGQKGKWEGGQQTEKYLKRYIEIFREQSFSIISMYRSIFPPSTTTANEDALLKSRGAQDEEDLLLPPPSALSALPLQLVGMLEETLLKYLPNVRDRSSRDSLLTQVLYCAGSLGRLGGDFGLLLANLSSSLLVDDEGDEVETEDWVEVTKKHRVLAGRLELMVGGKDGSS